MLWSRSPFGVSAGSSPAPVSRVGRSCASKLRSSEHSLLLRATTVHRPTERGLQGGRAARLRRSHHDPLARSPVAPARIPPPAPPVSPTGKDHGEALTPPETRETEHDKADQPQAKRGGERERD